MGSREALSIDEYLIENRFQTFNFNTVEKVHKDSYKDLVHFLPETIKQNLIF